MPADPNLINEYSPPVSGVLNCTAAGTTSFTCTNSCPWSVTGRDNQLPGLDSLGVRVEFTHTPVLGLFPFSGDMSLADRAVMRIEPDTRG
jgi:hypothetical protein